MEKRYFDTKQIAQYLNRSPKSIRNLCFRQQIPHCKIGGRLIFDLIEIQKWIKIHEVISSEKID